MALPFSEFPEIPLNFRKFMNNPKNNPNLEKPKKTNPNLKSFWAFLSSIFIYTSVFYIFSLSPSTLFCTTKFWFFISNTLVLIIAADFAAFTSAKWRGDVHEEHVIQDTSAVSSKDTITFTSSNIVSFKAIVIPWNETISYNVQENEEEKKPQGDVHEEHMIQDTGAISSKGTAIFPSSNVVSFKATAIPSNETTSYNVREDEEEKKPREKIIKVIVDRNQREKKREQCARSNSENAAMAAAAAAEEEGKAVVLHRTMLERHDHEEKNNEFSRMSNEELNRRVEEFIRRFNKQIRLQAVRNRHNLEMNAFN